MQSFVFCTCYINENNPGHNVKRYERWINFYLEKLKLLNCQYLFLIDDGSVEINLLQDFAMLDPFSLPSTLQKPINCVHFPDHLGRPSQREYRGWWRSFTFAITLAEKYKFDRIIHIESDFLVVSKRMAEYLAANNSGWVSLYSEHFSFPESGIQIISRDCYTSLRQVAKLVKQKDYYLNQSAELFLPFTQVQKRYLGDRFGEVQVLNNWLSKERSLTKLDWLGQVRSDFETADFEPFFELELKWH